MEILLFVNFLNHNNLAIGGGNDHTVCLAFEVAYWATEEVDHDTVHYKRDGQCNVEDVRCVKHSGKEPEEYGVDRQ